jgi:hypothetical protein
MNKKRPFLKLAIQKIESLFSKNKDNPVILSDIKDELSNRKTSRSKLLKNEVDKLHEISSNKDNKEKEQSGKNLEEFLKSISLEKFVLDYDVPIRLQHMILPELSFIKFNTIYDFTVATEDEKASLLRLPGFGKKSLNHLRFAIEDLIKEKLNIDYFDQSINELMCEMIIVEDNKADKAIVSNLDNDQEDALKNITLGFFVNNSSSNNNRTMNAILNAEKDGLLIYKNLYDFYIATSNDREELLNLENFGKGSLENLSKSVDTLIKDKKKLFFLSDSFLKSSDVSVFSSISELIDYAVEIIENETEQDIIKARHLDVNTLTLQEMGDKFGVTRERIRQKDKDAVNKVRGFISMFSQDNMISNFKKEIGNYFFSNNYFISKTRAKEIVKTGSKPIGLYIESISESLGGFLNEWFFYSEKFHGWFASEDIKHKNERNFVSAPSLDLDLAAQDSEWPITLSSLSNLMHFPECVVKDKVVLSSSFYLEELQNGIFVRLRGKMSVKSAVRYALRRYKRGMSLEEVKSNCLEMFGLELTIGAIGNALGELPDGLIVDTGTYALYENLNINDQQISAIRGFCKAYLLKEQKYISAFVVFNSLKRRGDIHEKYGDLDNGHMFFGVCQDDESFITKKGFMLGLNVSSFKGKYISLTAEIVDLMNREKRPLSIKEITDKLSTTRCLMPSSLQNMLENRKNAAIFEKVGNTYSLIGNEAHLEIDDEDLFEVDFDEI